jgi:hypothetical protein
MRKVQSFGVPKIDGEPWVIETTYIGRNIKDNKETWFYISS